MWKGSGHLMLSPFSSIHTSIYHGHPQHHLSFDSTRQTDEFGLSQQEFYQCEWVASVKIRNTSWSVENLVMLWIFGSWRRPRWSKGLWGKVIEEINEQTNQMKMKPHVTRTLAIYRFVFECCDHLLVLCLVTTIFFFPLPWWPQYYSVCTGMFLFSDLTYEQDHTVFVFLSSCFPLYNNVSPSLNFCSIKTWCWRG